MRFFDNKISEAFQLLFSESYLIKATNYFNKEGLLFYYMLSFLKMKCFFFFYYKLRVFNLINHT